MNITQKKTSLLISQTTNEEANNVEEAVQNTIVST